RRAARPCAPSSIDSWLYTRSNQWIDGLLDARGSTRRRKPWSTAPTGARPLFARCERHAQTGRGSEAAQKNLFMLRPHSAGRTNVSERWPVSGRKFSRLTVVRSFVQFVQKSAASQARLGDAHVTRKVDSACAGTRFG